MLNKKLTLFFSFTLFAAFAMAQEVDLEKMVDENAPKVDTRVSATFKGTKIIKSQSPETVKKGNLDFRVGHRFGNIGTGSGGGGHTLYGLDNSEDIRISFDYGITDNITIGIARNKRMENIDGTFKWRLIQQTTDNKKPFSLVLYTNAALTPMREADFYLGVDSTVVRKFAHRMAYNTQLIIARKFHWRFSWELIASYQHRNFVKAYINPANNAMDENGIFSAGTAFRFMFTKRFGIVVDYLHNFSAFRTGNTDIEYRNPLGLGIEIETGGHVFSLNFTNARGIIENDFIPNTNDDWLQGGFKFGFNISRMFTVVKPKK
jgi:hypothetical protein